MREKFPKPSGSHKALMLSNRYASDLSTTLNRYSSGGPGTNMAGYHGGSGASNAPLPAWVQGPVEISNNKINAADPTDSGLYLCKIRYYDYSDDTWKSQEKEWRLDANSMGVSLEVGDIVIAQWHQQRAMLVPINPGVGSPDTLVRFELEYELVPPGDNLVGTTTAHPVEWNGASYVPDLATTFYVFDLTGLRRGRGVNDAGVAGYADGAQGYAKRMPDSNRRQIIAMEEKAEYIRVELTEDMGTTSPGQASGIVHAYARGYNPDPSNAGVDVVDALGLFPMALQSPSGSATCKCTYDQVLDEYHPVECRQQFFIASASAAQDFECSDDPVAISYGIGWADHAGQDPVPAPGTADNPLGYAGEVGDDLIIFYNGTTWTLLGKVPCASLLCENMVADDDCWIACDDGLIVHLQPGDSLELADCNVYHGVLEQCGLCFDDGGHYVGQWILSGLDRQWYSPWFPEDPKCSDPVAA